MKNGGLNLGLLFWLHSKSYVWDSCTTLQFTTQSTTCILAILSARMVMRGTHCQELTQMTTDSFIPSLLGMIASCIDFICVN